MKKRLLIISVSAGSGHIKSAQAILEAAKKDKNIEVEHIDILDYVSKSLKISITEGYDFLIKKIPKVWGYVYRSSDKSRETTEKLYSMSSKLLAVPTKGFIEKVTEFNPDGIICTHSFPAHIIKRLGSDELKKKRLSILLTDYGAHNYWVVEGVDKYFVASENTKKALVGCGVKADKVQITGIPLTQNFFKKENTRIIRRNFGVPEESRVILLLSGGEGVVALDSIIEEILKVEWQYNLEVFAICGKGKSLKRKVDALSRESTKKIKVHSIGWTDRMTDYYSIADVVVGKPGGLTTTECLTRPLTFLMINPIPGQEEDNAKFVESLGRGKLVETPEDLVEYTNIALKKKAIKTKTILNKDSAEHIIKSVVS